MADLKKPLLANDHASIAMPPGAGDSGIADIMSMVTQFQNADPATKKGMLGGVPPEFQGVVQNLSELPKEDIATMAESAVALQAGGNPDPKALAKMHTCFKQLPVEGQKTLLLQLPEEVRPAVHSTLAMTEEDVESMATCIVELKQSQEATGEEGGQAGKIDPEMVGKLSSHFKKLPGPAKAAITAQLPENVQGLVQVAEGLSEAEVVVMVQLQAELGEGGEGGRELSPEERKAAEKRKRSAMKKAAKTLTYSEVRRVAKWCKQGPRSLQVRVTHPSRQGARCRCESFTLPAKASLQARGRVTHSPPPLSSPPP
jgi:hypothetical protein